MNTDTESRVRAALHATASELRQEDLRRPTLAGTDHRPLRGSALLVAATVAALILGIAVSVWMTRPANDTTAADAVVITPVKVTVEGLEIPVPTGWRALDQSTQKSWVGLCLEPQTPSATTSSSDCKGVMIRIARSHSDGTFDQLSGDGPMTACSPSLGGTTTAITSTPSEIGGRGADLWSIVCGMGQGPVISTFWRMSDMSLTLQSPFDGSLQEETADLAASIDPSRWSVKSGASAESSAALSPTG